MNHPSTPPMDHALALVHFSLSRQGNRDYNEDAYCHVRDDTIVSFAVADGMGGAAGGMQASCIAMDSVRQSRLTLAGEAFFRQILGISEAIKHEQALQPALADMCTTIAELRIDTYSQQSIWAHWGDTRLYWFRGGALHEVTEDHSVVQSLVSAGLLSDDDAAAYPNRNVLLGAAGAHSDIGPTILERTVLVAEGDAFLICTDGVWSVVNTDFIEERLHQSTCVQDWITAIMDEVARLGNGCNDNFTATGIWITGNNEITISPALHSASE